MKKMLTVLGATLTFGFFSGYIAYAHTVPGWDEPYDIDAYYSLTNISWADSPSPYAMEDLASNGGNVYDYTRHLKSILFEDKFKNILEVAANKRLNDEVNTTPFSEEIFSETAEMLKIIGLGTEKVSKQIDSQEIEKNLKQGDGDEWENFNPDFNHEEKFLWLNQQYKNFADGANEEVNELENVFESADKILKHTNMAEGKSVDSKTAPKIVGLIPLQLKLLLASSRSKFLISVVKFGISIFSSAKRPPLTYGKIFNSSSKYSSRFFFRRIQNFKKQN